MKTPPLDISIIMLVDLGQDRGAVPVFDRRVKLERRHLDQLVNKIKNHLEKNRWLEKDGELPFTEPTSASPMPDAKKQNEPAASSKK